MIRSLVQPPIKRDPTIEEIYGTPDTIGLAEQERMKRRDDQRGAYEVARVDLNMLAYGYGKLLGQSSGG